MSFDNGKNLYKATFKFSDVCQVINGRAYKRSELLNLGKYLVLRVGNFFSSDTWYFSDLELEDDKYCDTNDLLYAWSASFGPKIWKGGKAIFHYHIWKLVPNDKAEKMYLYYWLLYSREIMLKGLHGSVMGHLTKSSFESQLIELPTIRVQSAIARILASLDEKIEVNNRISKTLERVAQEIFKRWFVDFEFPNDEGEPYKSSGGEMVESELGFIPVNFKVIKLKEITYISTKSMDPRKNTDKLFEHYSIPAFDTNKFPAYDYGSQIKSNKYIVQNDSILVSKLNPTTKRVWRPQCISENTICSTEFINFISKDKDNYEYLHGVLESQPFMEYLCNRVTGSTGSRQRVKPIDSIDYKVVIPKNEEIKLAYNRCSFYIQEEIRSKIIENQKLIGIRETLLPKLMSGEIIVPMEEP